jgi:hypothetical protein
MKRLSVRWKLTLWYGGVLAVVLLVFGAAVFLTMRHQLLERIDQGLAEELAEVRYEVKQATDPDALHKWLERRFSRHEGMDFQITRPSGELFFVSERVTDKSLPVPVIAAGSDSPVYEGVRIGSSGRWRVVSIRVTGPDGPLVVQVARSLADYEHELQELLLVFLMTGPLT